jgi:glycosyltransferase involved in cell wall biosynthesis
LYDNFGEKISKDEARKYLQIEVDEPIILFFGFIRKYKGLDMLLDAMKILQTTLPDHLKQPKLLVAGEFYGDRKPYDEQIERLGIKEQLILHTNFIADKDVRYFLCAADVVVQPYRTATQSGVTPLAYHFEKPMVVTNVGGLASLVPHEKVGLVAEPTPQAIADAILRFYQLGENYFIPHLRTEKQKYSWSNLVNAVTKLAEGITERTSK